MQKGVRAFGGSEWAGSQGSPKRKATTCSPPAGGWRVTGSEAPPGPIHRGHCWGVSGLGVLEGKGPIHRGSAGDFADKMGWSLGKAQPGSTSPVFFSKSFIHFSLSFPLCKMGIITGLLEFNGKGYVQGSTQPLSEWWC